MKIPATNPDFEREAYLDALISVEETARIRGCSTDTLERLIRRGELEVIRLSPRRRGIRRRHALMLDKETA